MSDDEKEPDAADNDDEGESDVAPRDKKKNKYRKDKPW